MCRGFCLVLVFLFRLLKKGLSSFWNYFSYFSPDVQLQRVQGQFAMEQIICWLLNFTLNGENESGRSPGQKDVKRCVA